jgi:hypothetical protein
MGHEVEEAASKPKQAKWDAGAHELTDQALAEREDWLAKRFGAG